MKNAKVEKKDIDYAKILGNIGFAKGLKAPAQDSEFMQLLKKYRSEYTAINSLLKAWTKGWHEANVASSKSNNLEAKKLAVIKSNAAPEVKLKALNKLNATLTLKRGGGDELLELSPEAQKAMKERFKTAQPSSDKMVLREAVKRMFKQGKKLSEIEKALKIKIDYDGVAPAKDIPAGQFEIKNAMLKNAAPDDKLAGPKKALSALLGSLGYAQMSKDVLKETELEKLKPYARAVLSDMQKQTKPAIKDKLPRVQELLSKLGVL